MEQLVQPTDTVDATAGTRALVQAHAAMIASLQNSSGVSLTDPMLTHPVFGPLNLYHFIVALGLHDQCHAAQIREIGESFAATWRDTASRHSIECTRDVYTFLELTCDLSESSASS